jgi:group I intron endonuclease
MFYLIYKITNNLNNKIYIGSHKTKKINDNYMGSGKYLTYAIQKYGSVNFTKEILFIFDNPKDMYVKEAEIVNEQFLAEENTYNLKKGGYGGFDYICQHRLNVKNGFNKDTAKNISKLGVQKIKELIKNNPDWQQERNKITSLALKGRKGAFTNRTHSASSKLKMRGPRPDKAGNRNSQFGTCWIYHPLVGNKKCQKKLLPEYIEQGWFKGRN